MKFAPNKLIVAVGFWLAVAILIGIGLATHQSTVRLLATSGRVERARNVTENLHRIRFALQEAETLTRQLINTDDMTRQKARLLAAAQVTGAFNRLQRFAADLPAQAQDIAALGILAADRLHALDEAVQIRNMHDRATANQFLDTEQNRALATQIDATLFSLVEAERQALLVRDAELQAKAHISVALFVLGCFISLGILAGVFFYLNIQITARRTAEAALVREKMLLQQQYQRQAALAEIELAINQPHELQPALERIVHAVTELMPAGNASVLLWEDGTVQAVTHTGTLPTALQEPARRWIVEHKQTLIVPDSSADPFGSTAPELGAYVGVPLLLDNEALGILYALDRIPRQYRDDERDFLESLAARAALAISKIRLYDRLQHINRLLEQHVSERTRELVAANAQLVHEADDRRRAEEALQVLSGQLLQLQDQERRHIARELHDVTAQNLSAITLNLARVETLLAGADTRAVQVIADSIQLAEECLREIRTLSYVLHPPMLDEYGLPRALEWYLEGFCKRSDVHVELTVASAVGRLTADTETALFRIVQESLTNIRRHSGSRNTVIQLTRDSKSVTLLIQDDGHGFREPLAADQPPTLINFGVGVAGMHERLRQLGGKLQIDSGPTGTTVRAVVPVTGEQI